MTAFAHGEPKADERLQCFAREWAYSAAVVEDFGGRDALRKARHDARSSATQLDDFLGDQRRPRR